MSVLGQPSVLYLRRSQPPSRYQPSSPSSAIFASTSSSLYGWSFSSVAMALPPWSGLHHRAAVDVDGLPGDEGRRGRRQVHRRGGDVRRGAPAPERGGLRDGAPEPRVGLLAERRL